ncbi:MAG: hypothetical protein A3I33_03090 [Candidatus Colwellbacteria bacterium RIFCSPLOWO2_02_FULL_45_11]|uniref:Type ii secretion system protein e, type IV pilus assembly protein PilB n=3 Tax=Parcubacteria group TaxID=1794811 RepID=A0A0H4TX93_9BACT|nr:type ii secretion system protein e, type IV pilus assembly protein PilB [uncultured Parcubacteria bacterium Rifle_16ft_4_minimus_37647]AKQ05624.1 type ii secretion system protein e, type IV pilus assembly protein PilB [uncultured Parcubacteria bacterium Rifle_16ft_4_minimus_23790]OGY61731.1 MAG: hypothetical protein A3I33_03090 [Candidatus Colwellbacteria bacterium RIFCSPLOWO2_02_FULL_45_11]
MAPGKVAKSQVPSTSTVERELSQPAGEVSIIKLVDGLITNAYESRASDIHLDPDEDVLNVRLRIDGVLHHVFTLPKEIHPEVISRIKVLSGLRTDEHQAPQDGRIKFTTLAEAKGPDKRNRLSFDIRVSIIPTYHGENGVLRLLAEQGQAFELESVGLTERDLKIVQRAITFSYGMILVTGPTGSGKTTTLYTMLKKLNIPQVSIITIEDPIEYSLQNVNQIQVNSQTNLTFAKGLRSILRQDPNIVMVGEIRDEETAGIAVNAALTGHLLLSTIHTNDAATTLPRLLDMKVEPFLIASTVNIAIGQRLVRTICNYCKKEKELTQAELESLKASLPEAVGLNKKKFYYGAGCEECGSSGYLGRIGIYEVLEITPAIKRAITEQKSSDDIEDIARSEGMTTMVEDGLKKAEAGITSLEEVLRVMHE